MSGVQSITLRILPARGTNLLQLGFRCNSQVLLSDQFVDAIAFSSLVDLHTIAPMAPLLLFSSLLACLLGAFGFLPARHACVLRS
jgi:hypothetical protein